MRGVGNSNLPLLISFSERLLICLFLLSFSFFSLFFGLLDFLIFFPTLPHYPHPFRTFYLPWNTATSNIDILLAVPLVTCRKYRYVTHSLNFPPISFLPASLSFLRIRKFSYCLSFSFFLTYFFLFLLISFSRFLFRSFFSFPCSQAKSAKKICSFFKKI